MSDDDQSPTIITGGQPGGVGFSAFGEDERKAERRARRKNLAVKTLAGAVVLAAVGGVAALTSKGAAKTAKGPAAAGAPSVGKVVTPTPPQVIFENDKLGYVFYSGCKVQPHGDGCQAALYRTVDGAQHWDPMTLPPDAPVDPGAWVGMQVRGNNTVLLAWHSGVAVSQDGGVSWKPVKIDADASTSQVASSDFVVSDTAHLVLVDPQNATGVVFRAPQKVEIPGGTGGALAGGQLWVADVSDIGVSIDGGLHWQVAPLASDGLTTAPLVNSGGQLAQLTGLVADATTGWPGDGGDLKATHVLFSTNQGATWTSSALLTGPSVNALCTVYLDDGTLLGVASDKSSLLQLTGSGSAFAPATSKPTTTPACLASDGALVWGPTQATNQVALSTSGGKDWTMLDLPNESTQPHGVATPSPTPSIAR